MSKKTKKSVKKSAPKKTHRTMAERADAAARAAEAEERAALEAKDGLKRVEPELKTRAFPGATLPPKKTKKAAAPKEKVEKEPRVTVTSVAEDFIRAGRTDEEVLEALTLKFSDFDAAKKKHYPSWYRARLVRTGAITKAFADEHRHAKE